MSARYSSIALVVAACFWFTPTQAQTVCCKIVGTHYVNVGTRMFVPQSIDTTDTEIMSRTGHYMRAGRAVSVAAAVCGNFPINYEGGSQVTPSICKISIEYPLGTCTLLTWGGNNSVSVPYGTLIKSDMNTLSVTIPDNALYWTRRYDTNAATLYTVPNHNDNTNMGDATVVGTSVTDQTVSCDPVTNSASSTTMPPLAVIALSAKPSISVLGDSLVFGAFDTYDNASGDLGVLDRSIGPSLAYIDASIDGLAAQSIAGLAGLPWYALFNTYSSSTIVELGVNDTVGNGRTLLQVQGYLSTIYSFFTTATFQTTITPTTTSTDNWATSGNQTAQAGSSTSIALNDSLRADTFGPNYSYLEVANAWSTAQDSNIWKNPGAGFAQCSPPVSGLYWTDDGTHGTPCGYLQVPAAGTINLAKLR